MAVSEKTLFDFPLQERTTPDRSLTARWQHEELFRNGFVAVPVLFLQLYAHLKPHPLTAGEALFALELMTFKWSSDAPFPSYERISKRMGVTAKAARRYAKDMEAKGYLQREKRIGQTNRFDLTGLFDALLKAAERMEAHQASKEVKGDHV